MAILAHLKLPGEAPPVARARSLAFDFASAYTISRDRRTRNIVAKAAVCGEEGARERSEFVG